jgi:fucose permease
MNNENRSNFLPLKILLHFSFLIVGIVTFILGNILPIISKRLQLNDEQAGFFGTSQFYGSIIGTISTAFLIRKIGFVKTIGLGFLFFACGMAGVNLTDFWLGWASVSIYGIGVGLLIPSILMSTAALNPFKTTSALNFMSAFWAIGAVISQPFVAFFGGGTIFLPTIIIASLSIILAALYLIFIADFTSEADNENDDSERIPIWSNPKSWLIVAFGLCDVGIESGVGVWLTTYTMRSNLPSEIWWFSATPIFFAFFAIGRAVAAGLARILSNNQIIWASLTLTVLGTILLILSTGWQTIFFSAAILGLGLAAVFPTNMSRFTETFGAAANKQTVPLFVMGSVGSITIVWLIGHFSTAYESLRAGLGVLLAAAIILIIFQFLFQIMHQNRKS